MQTDRTRTRPLLPATLWLLALLALSPSSARAAALRPFALGGVAQVLGDPFAPGGAGFTLTGAATPLGDYAGPGHVQFAYVGKFLTSTGTVTLQAGDGAKLFTAFAAVQDPRTGVFQGVFSIEGGTGRFAGARGGGWLTATPTGATTFQIAENGTIIGP